MNETDRTADPGPAPDSGAAPDPGPAPGPGTGGLREALTNRQMTMIAIGGVIGAGLFVGSGSAIAQAGPAVLIAYAVIGALVVLVMRMLAELAVASPETGSFSSYAGRELGRWAGLSVGWLYAYHWCVTIGFEAISGAAIVHQLLPSVPTWLAALVVMAALIAVNFSRVENFGTFEFWFAMIKVAAICVFLLIGIGAVLGAVPGHDAPGLSHLTGDGGFVPKGWTAVLQASLVVFFSYFGTEALTVAAGEARQPAEAVRRGMRSVVWRILLFYVGSIAVVVTLMPWNGNAVTESPFVAVLGNLGIPHATTIMNIVVLTAVLSCLNSGLYASSRMVYSLARRGEAPAFFARTSGMRRTAPAADGPAAEHKGVPSAALLLASSVGLIVVVANYFLPTTTIFDFLLKSSGSVAVVTYVAITVTHLRGRARLERTSPGSLTVRMWAYPYLSVLVLVVLVAVIAGMAVTASSRRSLLLTLVVTAVTVVSGVVHQRLHRSPDVPGETVEPAGSAGAS